MADAPQKTDVQAELEKKLADIGEKEQSIDSRKLAEELGLPFAELQGLPIDPDALKELPEERARAAQTAPVQVSGGTVVIVTADPRNPDAAAAIGELKAAHEKSTVVVVSAATMQAVLERYATVKTAETFEVGAITVDDETLSRLSGGIKNVQDLQGQLASASVTELFEVLVAGALSTQASDIHIEPEADAVRVRYRLDGLLHEIATLDRTKYQRLGNRIKVLSKMKLNITKAPQDGRFTIRQSGVDIEVRVSALPAEYGESIVMRLLDPRGIKAKLEELGMRADILAQCKDLLARPQGTLLTTGPTGSGKTTTLYAFLNHLNTPDMKIITVEDPIEYHIAGLNQTQVDVGKGYTFASGLRAIVRQDPDVILIGEIRDQETADIALQAALTGHMVLSTIHTNDAAGTIPRLIDIGSKPETIAPALTMAMGQRLLRRLCPECKKPAAPSPEDRKKMEESLAGVAKRLGTTVPGDDGIFGPTGCAKCNNLGYKGRVGVYEVFEVTREMEQLIMSSPGVSDVRDQAVKQGMVTMLQDGYLKVAQGITSLEEVRRVLG